MKDPLGELEESLAYMFELQKTQDNGKYISPLVAELKKAIENYREDSANLSSLNKAINNAYPVIENYVDSYKVKQKMEVLSGKKGESIKWYTQSRWINARRLVSDIKPADNKQNPHSKKLPLFRFDANDEIRQ